MIHLSAILFKRTQTSNWERGVAVITEAGMSDVITLLDSKGYAIVASDGGSCAIWTYSLCPAFGAISIPTE